MNFKYAVCVSFITLASVGFLMYAHEYHTSTFVQITAVFPQLHSLTIQLHSLISKWFGSKPKTKERRKNALFSKEVLKTYSQPSKGLYLALLGKVYDVGKGETHYGPGGSYHFFTGRDASRAFITGDFSDSGLTDDVIGLSPEELLGLEEWVQFYRKEYKYKGKLIGRYYDSNGQPTQYNQHVRELINEAKNTKEEDHKEKLLYPPCNAEWSQDSGSRVWCTTMSGGIQRDWVGVPRQMYEPGSKSYRCACIKEDELNGYKKGNLKEYPDCNPKSSSCRVYS